MNFPKLSNHAVKVRLIALFIALSLAVTWYYQIKRWAVGVPGNSTNLVTFYAMSKTANHMESLGVWRARIGGLWIAGRLFDSVVTNGLINLQDYQAQKIILMSVERQDKDTQQAWGRYFYIDAYQHVFGLYHACWLFLFFVMLIVFLENPVFVIFGTFAGLLYTLTPAAICYSYAWDMPAMTFFTLGYLLWQRKHYNWMVAVILIGCPFKETVAVVAILFFFAEIPVPRRIAYFLGAALLAFLQKIAIMEINYGQMTVFTQHLHAGVTPGFFGTIAWANIKDFFTPKWNHFIFVNGGTLIIAMLLPMRSKNDVGTKVFLAVFFVCQFLAGALNEFRIMLEALPLALLCLSQFLNINQFAPQTVATLPKAKLLGKSNVRASKT